MRFLPLLLLGPFFWAQEVPLFEQIGDPQWDEPTYDAGGFSYHIVADDFAIPFDATVTRWVIYGDFPMNRELPLQNIALLLMADNNGAPGTILFAETYADVALQEDDSIVLPADLDLESGTYWLAVYERFDGNVNLPESYGWRGAPGVTYGGDYHISEGGGVGPGSWFPSAERFQEPARLFFEVHGIPSIGEIPAPSFITDRDVWIDDQGKINVWCPNPNADGFVKGQTVKMGYVFNLVQDCMVLSTATATPATYPKVFKFPVGVPEGPYTIEVSRVLIFDFSKRQAFGSVKVISGPALTGNTPVISTDYREVQRWLLHVPKVSGGFKGRLVLNNRFPDLPVVISIAGFDASGNYIKGSVRNLSVVGNLVEVPIYPDGSANSVFESGFTDQISHIGLFEPNNQNYLKASLIYSSVQDNALTATVPEAALTDGTAVGQDFIMEARQNDSFWDGVALLNLTGQDSVQLKVEQRRISDKSLVKAETLSSVSPGDKNLVVLSSLFPFVANTYYQIQATNGVRFQVLGLRGTTQAAPPLMTSSKIGKVK
ncbi:MAG: hypothetical protein H6510_02365 [Acidobacteria bacterium]|nr:hypothetical protein [Acidobacteriota bacterium]MCB9396638.1 hypothetical protein [Acidobacteriota bacterium]